MDSVIAQSDLRTAEQRMLKQERCREALKRHVVIARLETAGTMARVRSSDTRF
jgi:hypothetical protein